jgi:hypothetical protein
MPTQVEIVAVEKGTPPPFVFFLKAQHFFAFRVHFDLVECGGRKTRKQLLAVVRTAPLVVAIGVEPVTLSGTDRCCDFVAKIG